MSCETLSRHFPRDGIPLGYARWSASQRDLAAQRQVLPELRVIEDRIYTDHGLTGTTRARPGLDQALVTARQGDTLVVPKQDRLAESVPDVRAIVDLFQEHGAELALGRTLYAPGDPREKMFVNILATFPKFEADVIRMRTREGKAIACAKGKLRGKPPKLSNRQQVGTLPHACQGRVFQQRSRRAPLRLKTNRL